jgi:predicted AlkP superfamily pyrophosphatase or phosphodiesterase
MQELLKLKIKSKIIGIILVTIFLPLANAEEIFLKTRPKLVLFLVIDQFAYDYIPKLVKHWNGGFKYLIDNGALYTEAHHAHALTETCPGHATLISGSYPSISGIVSNDWYDHISSSPQYCIKDHSPVTIKTTTLGDWLKNYNPKSKVYSVSGKDRAAIMLGGHKADGAYWYDKNSGNFRSSQYYKEYNSPWLNQSPEVNKLFGQGWELSKNLNYYQNIKGFTDLSFGLFNKNFPHSIGGMVLKISPQFYEGIYLTPYLDNLTLRVASDIISANLLGKDDSVDLLAISFSALDVIGHEYGPQSYEVLDTLIRLDKNLDNFFTLIDQNIGLKNTLIVLSADHGIQPFPEERKLKGLKGSRLEGKDLICLQKALKQVLTETKLPQIFSYPWVFHSDIKKLSLAKRQIVVNSIKNNLKRCTAIENVWSSTDLITSKRKVNLATKNLRLEDYRTLYSRSYYPLRSPDIIIQPRKYFNPMFFSGTNHGTPYRYDTRIPLIFAHPDIGKCRINKYIETVNVAPLIAKYLKIPVATKIFKLHN